MTGTFNKKAFYEKTLSAFKAITSNQNNKEINFDGFGALKELLLPIDDLSGWNQTDLQYKDYVFQIHDLIKNIYGNRYKEILDSIKNSILTSFYTPEALVNAIVIGLKDSGFEASAILDPSAGSGNFIPSLQSSFPNAKITAIEKEKITFDILSNRFDERIEKINNGFENVKATGNYDLVISNIPFGSIKVYDDQIYKEAKAIKIQSTTRIHNYYFVKSLDHLQEGGLIAFITSSSLADTKGNEEIRKYLVNNSDLISAYRLPNNVFKSTGTEPVTDIIILRKNRNKKGISHDEKLFISSEVIELNSEKGIPSNVDINGYFNFYRDKIFGSLIAGGQYGRLSLDVIDSENNVEEKILSLKDSIKNDVKGKSLKTGREISITKESTNEDKTVIPKNFKGYDYLKEGNLIAFNGQSGIVIKIGNYFHFKRETAIKSSERTALVYELRTALNSLIDSEINNASNMEVLRKELNEIYNRYTFQYGKLSVGDNKKLLSFDSEGFKLFALELFDREKNEYKQSDIFYKQVNNVAKNYDNINKLSDAILLSLNAKNCIDIKFIAELTDKYENEIIEEGLSSELFFVEFGKFNDYNFVPKDEFVSGNIVEKIENFEGLKNNPIWLSKEHFDKHYSLLLSVRPPYLKRELIDVNIGVHWVPLDIYERFAKEIFNTDNLFIKHLKSSGDYIVKISEDTTENEITYSAKTNSGLIKGDRILEYAMLDTVPLLRIKVSENPDEFIPDVQGMKNVQQKIKLISDKWLEFSTKNIDVSKRIEEIYNRKINNYVKRNFNGKHLTFEGLEYFQPREYQPDAVWKLVQNDGGIIDHTVGAGKSLTMAMAAWKMKKLGIANKPLILCLKANVGAVAEEFKRAFPDAKVLAPTEKDFNPENRKRIFASIAANDWDAVVLTHDNLSKIPQDPRMVKAVLEEELENLEDDLKIAKGNSTLSKRVLKGLEKRKEKLRVRVAQAEAKAKRDDYVMNFNVMGFDHLFIDESQEFKNLPFTTRQENIPGLGNPTGAEKARNLLTAVRTIQEKKGGDYGITFATGTPISNSLVELYLLKKYLRPNKLKEAEINSFDAWVKMFGKKISTYEFTVTNELKIKTRYREFVNLPELAMWYNELSHVVTAADLKDNKPKLEHIMVNIDPTEAQEEYIKKLVEFTKTKNGFAIGLGRPLTKGEENAYMLMATNYAKKMSMDMRLISSDYEYDPNSKIGNLCSIIKREYQESQTFKGTQLVFSDIGTPGTDGFNVYGEIRRVLNRYHDIPSEEVAFIHEYKTKKQRKELFNAVNEGKIRVLIGSTKKLGTGVNVQKRLIAVHHIDIPWRPSDMEQRDGRICRQNAEMVKLHRNNTARSYVYAVNKTLDAYQFNILSNKQMFISQLKTNTKDRRIDEGSMDESGTMNFAEYVAMLSGNPDLLEKVKLEKQLGDLEKDYNAFLNSQKEMQYQVSFLASKNEKDCVDLEKFKVDNAMLTQIDPEATEQKIQGKVYKDRKEAGEVLIEMQKKFLNDFKNIIGEENIGVYAHFNLVYDFQKKKFFAISEKTKLKYSYSDGLLNENPALAGRYFLDAVKRVPKIIENYEEEINARTEKINAYKKELSNEFGDIKTIQDLKFKIEELNNRIENGASDNKIENKPDVEEPREKYGLNKKNRLRVKF